MNPTSAHHGLHSDLQPYAENLVTLLSTREFLANRAR